MDVNELGEIKAYMLVWYGPNSIGVHLWRYSDSFKHFIEEVVSRKTETIVQLYHSQDLAKISGLLERLDVEFRVETFLDMFVNEELFRPYNPQKAVRLDPKHHIEQFIELKKVQGREISKDFAENIIRKWRYYGVFRDSKLVAIACRYIALPEIWIIGDVFTHPEYRGLGYGKMVTSAITRDAVASGAEAYLHVNKENSIAISVYKRLGYVVLRERPWIFIY